jgi:hypothetical protein
VDQVGELAAVCWLKPSSKGEGLKAFRLVVLLLGFNQQTPQIHKIQSRAV